MLRFKKFQHTKKILKFTGSRTVKEHATHERTNKKKKQNRAGISKSSSDLCCSCCCVCLLLLKCLARWKGNVKHTRHTEFDHRGMSKQQQTLKQRFSSIFPRTRIGGESGISLNTKKRSARSLDHTHVRTSTNRLKPRPKFEVQFPTSTISDSQNIGDKKNHTTTTKTNNNSSFHSFIPSTTPPSNYKHKWAPITPNT